LEGRWIKGVKLTNQASWGGGIRLACPPPPLRSNENAFIYKANDKSPKCQGQAGATGRIRIRIWVRIGEGIARHLLVYPYRVHGTNAKLHLRSAV